MVKQYQGRKIVVVTHHAPSANSLAPADRQHWISSAFASHLDEFVVESKAALWIHGHVHTAQDYDLGETRVVCNPRGYPGEEQTGFDTGMIVEVL
jgi:Icc-related predicted phosphoesterase